MTFVRLFIYLVIGCVTSYIVHITHQNDSLKRIVRNLTQRYAELRCAYNGLESCYNALLSECTQHNPDHIKKSKIKQCNDPASNNK